MTYLALAFSIASLAATLYVSIKLAKRIEALEVDDFDLSEDGKNPSAPRLPGARY